MDNLRPTCQHLIAALEGVLNCACHPDVAIRAVLVPLQPVRAAIAEGKAALNHDAPKPS